MKLIAEGFLNREIAACIHRSIKTVEKHRQSILNKLRIHDTANLTRCALAIGLTAKTPRRSGLQRAMPLSPRQTQVLQMVAQGFTNKWIADMLHLAIKTIEKHRTWVIAKLDIHETAGLTRYAVAHELLCTGPAGSETQNRTNMTAAITR